MRRKTMLQGECLENRCLLAGDVPTFDDGVFALPEDPEQLATLEIRRTDAQGTDDETMLVVFVPDDEGGSLASLGAEEPYEVRALARARHRIVYFGTETAEFKLRGSAFLSFGVIKGTSVTDWLRASTQQTDRPSLGFLFPLESHEVAGVRALGNQRWELKWDDGEQDYTYELQLNSPALEAEVLLESFVNAQTADEPPGVLVETGDFVSRNYAVTNPGNLPLTQVVVTDDNATPADPTDDFMPPPNLLGDSVNLGDLDQDQQLDPGEVWLYSSPHTARDGQYSSEARVTAVAGEQSLQARDAANYFGSAPEQVDLALIDVLLSPDPADNQPGDAPLLLEVGQAYQFRPVIRNAGNVELTVPWEVEADYRGQASTIAADQALASAAEFTMDPIEITESETGTFEVTFRLDPQDLISEVDESAASNQWSRQLQFAKPDVSIVDFIATPTPLDPTELGEDPIYDVGQAYQLLPVIRNTGPFALQRPFEVAIEYRQQATIVSVEQTLLPGELLTLPGIEVTETAPGDFPLALRLDPANQLDESDETEQSNQLVALLRFE